MSAEKPTEVYSFEYLWKNLNNFDKVKNILFFIRGLKQYKERFNIDGHVCGHIPQIKSLKWMYENGRFDEAMNFIGLIEYIDEFFLRKNNFEDIVVRLKECRDFEIVDFVNRERISQVIEKEGALLEDNLYLQFSELDKEQVDEIINYLFHRRKVIILFHLTEDGEQRKRILIAYRNLPKLNAMIGE